ncbi:ATP-binding protein [Pseudoneobacillus sp. C159]
MLLNGKMNYSSKNYSNDITLDRLAAVGQIAAGIAHEVRNPLTTVKGFLHLLKEERPHSYLDIAVDELENALLTMQNLLNVSKPDLDEESFSNINLTTEIEAILYLFQNQVYHVSIEKYFEDTHVTVYGKRNQIKKALFNLIKNAFEAMPEAGIITIKHYFKNEKLLLSIQDTGVGIPKDKLGILGTPFFTSKESGTGMGLTQVYSTIYEHNGKVSVTSEVGVGTCFMIEFPVQENRYLGVLELNLQYVENQTFSDFYEENKKSFMELLKEQGKGLFDHILGIKEIDSEYVINSADQIVTLLNAADEFGLVLHAKEHGKNWAKSDLELFLKLEWFQSLRKTYWDFQYNYSIHQEISIKEVFEIERLINYNLDTYIKHFSASFSEYKSFLIEAQNELIDDLNVPIIPMSDTMAILPIIGTVDTRRAKVIQLSVLEQIHQQNIKYIIIDLSGVTFLDTGVLNHLFKIINGIRIQGCEAVLTGVRPEITNTIVELGIELNGKVATKGTLKQAIQDYNEWQFQMK